MRRFFIAIDIDVSDPQLALHPRRAIKENITMSLIASSLRMFRDVSKVMVLSEEEAENIPDTIGEDYRAHADPTHPSLSRGRA